MGSGEWLVGSGKRVVVKGNGKRNGKIVLVNGNVVTAIITSLYERTRS